MTNRTRCIDSGSWVPVPYRYADGTAWCGNCGKRVRRSASIDMSARYCEHRMDGRPLPPITETELRALHGDR